jgi:phosphatidylserine/phosphatidylglycerophosphate/cardiolipin synthase-like enzyme
MKTRRRLGRRLTEPFEIVGGNELLAAEHGPTFFEGMLEAIANSRVTVDVEMYLWDDDEVGRRFIEALRDAAARGLRVRILIDAVGARGVASKLDAVDDAGGDVREFSPFRIGLLRRYFHRTHKKLLICDGENAFTGGAGFSLHWSSGRHSDQAWHDRMFHMRGPVAGQLVTLFESDFERWRPRRERVNAPPALPVADITMAGSAELRLLRGWPDAFDFRATLLECIRGARERVWLGSPYFIPPPSLLRALTAALRRGVDVRLVLPSGNFAHPLLWHASRRHYGWFLKRGARIHEFRDSFYHAKLAVIDRTAAIVGSSNLDYWSWDRNAEIDLLATDAPTVCFVAELFESDQARSRAVTLAEVRRRSWWAFAEEAFLGGVERWL